MTLEPEVVVDREILAWGRSEDRESVMASRFKWNTPPSATRICWLTTDAQDQRIAILHQDDPA